MTSGDVLQHAILQPVIPQPVIPQCWAVVYVRQSTQSQIETNTEGRRRQYELVEVARRRGCHAVAVIDEDLGRSASGMGARPGFEKLVATFAPSPVHWRDRCRPLLRCFQARAQRP